MTNLNYFSYTKYRLAFAFAFFYLRYLVAIIATFRKCFFELN